MILRETFAAGPFQCNCTVIACGDTKDAIVIDPGGETDRIAEIVAQYDLTVRSIIHTHAHLDHIYCTRDVKEAHGGEVCLHPDDRFLYDGAAMQAAMFGWTVRPMTAVDRWLADGDAITFGKRTAQVVHTPGHTPGSICFEVAVPGERTLVFAGDTLFRRSVGRTDLPGGDPAEMDATLREVVMALPRGSRVLPGHGPGTDVATELATNPYLPRPR